MITAPYDRPRPSFANGYAIPGGYWPIRYPQLWRGCVGAWSAGLGAQGVTLRDQSGNNNHGTLTNMDPATDYLGGALDLDGTDDYVSVSDSSSLDSSAVMTFAIWLKTAGAWPSSGAIAAKNGTVNIWQYGLGVSSGVLYWLQSPNGTTWGTLVAAGSLPPTQKWVSIIGRNNAKAAHLFIDGAVTGSADLSPAASLYASSGALRIGSNVADSVLWYFAGHIDDVRQYDRGISDDEVAILASRRNITYELAPQYYSLQGAAAAESRQSLTLLGVG